MSRIFAFLLLACGLLPAVVAPCVAAPDDTESPLSSLRSVGETDDETPEEPRLTETDLRVSAAVEKGLKHLASIQNPEDGSWANNVGNKLGNRYQINPDGYGKPHLGVTAICCMAFMAAGHTPDRGEYHRNVRDGVKFILGRISYQDGWISAYGTRMYSHAFCALCLAEVYGMTGDVDVLEGLRSAVKFIVESQNRHGAWRYSPNQADSDMSICVCQLQALRAAANVGVHVPTSSIEDAKGYVRGSYQRTGAFVYQHDWDARATFALTAAGVVALQSLGEYDSHSYVFEDPTTGREFRREINLQRSIAFLQSSRPDRDGYLSPRTRLDYGFWYGHYYAAQAMYQYQFVDTRAWAEWHADNVDHFLRMQHGNGAWTDEIGGEDETRNAYGTAMACLILSIPRGYLPIFQN